MDNLKKIFLFVVFFSFLYVSAGYTAKKVSAYWTGTIACQNKIYPQITYSIDCSSGTTTCYSSNDSKTGECTWVNPPAPSNTPAGTHTCYYCVNVNAFCASTEKPLSEACASPNNCNACPGGGGNPTAPPASSNTCSGITYSTIPTTPVPGQGLQLDISRAGATSSCGINNVGLIYDGVSSWSSNPGFGLALNGATGYRANFSSIPAGTHTFQFTFANDACKCNTFSLNILSDATPVITQPAATVTPISSSATPANCPLKQKGDANCDGKVDDADYQVWKCEFLGGGTCANPNSYLTANFDLNTKVDLVDFEIWRSNRN